MADEEVQRPEVLAGPTSGRAPAGSGDATGAAGVPDPRNQRQAPGQKGYGPGGPQIGSTGAPLTEVDVEAVTAALEELKGLREGMEQADHVPTIIRQQATGKQASGNQASGE